jgi:iron complex transport system ATP-binding protein
MLKLTDCTIGAGKALYRIGEAVMPEGKVTALIGANGAGKSTLLNAIALGDAASGRMAWNDVLLADLSPSARARILSLVESRFGGVLYLSALEYLQLGRFPHTGLGGKLSEADKNIVMEFSDRLNLTHLLSRSTVTLSDGERQRAGIARALIQQTPLILLDEPTSFLDYPNKRAIMQLLSEIARRDGKAVLLASHDLELCLSYCDQLLVINPQTNLLESYAAADLTLELLVNKAFGDS